MSAPSGEGVRQIRLAKPEEGSSKGEVWHLLRAGALLVGLVALLGWVLA